MNFTVIEIKTLIEGIKPSIQLYIFFKFFMPKKKS